MNTTCFHVRDWEGNEWYYKSELELHTKLLSYHSIYDFGFNLNDVRVTYEYHCWHNPYNIFWHKNITKFVVYDSLNRVVDPKDLLEISERNKRVWHYPRCSRDPADGYRCMPVPNTGTRFWNFKCHFKTPKTAQEKRQSFTHPELVRPKRRKNNLPESWDDNYRHNQYSWKSQGKRRRRQWMRD